jgi:hypothetical protein
MAALVTASAAISIATVNTELSSVVFEWSFTVRILTFGLLGKDNATSDPAKSFSFLCLFMWVPRIMWARHRLVVGATD